MKTIKQFYLLLVLPFVITACQKEQWPCKKGEGAITTEQRQVPLFKGLDLASAADVILTYDTSLTSHEVSVETYENLQQYVKLRMSGTTLVIEHDHCFKSPSEVKVYVKLATGLEKVVISGSGQISTANLMHSPSVETIISGSGRMDLDIHCTEATLNISGSGNMVFKGSSKSASCVISGSGSMQLYAFKVDRAKVSIPGSGLAEVYVYDDLDVTISGSGSVCYKGDPVLHSNISGSGSLSRCS